MSEYQYYEWQTIDRPLTAEQQAAVKKLSSHIDVTSTRAVVTYNWSNFKHDPKQVLARYFDAFLYFANWGSQRLAFRFPKGLLDTQMIQPYLWEYCVELEPIGDYLVLDISFPDDDGECWFEEDAQLSGLARLRDDILEGDYRVLYLAWLLAASVYATDEEPEPPVPPGLNQLSSALTEFVWFFQLDKYLVQAAAQASEPRQATPDIALEEAIARLPRAECDAFLVRLARGEPHLSLILNRRLQTLAGRPPVKAGGASRRTWGELTTIAKKLRQDAVRRKREAAEKKRIQALQALASREAETWRQVHALIEQKKARSYDEAVALLVKLNDLAIYQDRLPEFREKLDGLRAQYTRRPALQARLQRAGL